MDLFLGIDFGTSGCRASLIDGDENLHFEAAVTLPAPQREGPRVTQSAQRWIDGLEQLFAQLADQTSLQSVRKIAIDGTSGSVLLTSLDGEALTPALMYNDASSTRELEELRATLEAQSISADNELCLSLSSGLVKALQLAKQIKQHDFLVLNQADFLSNTLAGTFGHSDYHNALKLGYDPLAMRWPFWIANCLPANSLPEVHPPGTVMGSMSPRFAQRFGFSHDVQICAGSTDSNAAFIAAKVNTPGDAVTSLGSTLVVKLLSKQPVTDLRSGVYSHRLGDFWLLGGASNAGAAILRDFFSDDEIRELSQQLDPEQPSQLDYYPLRSAGERFPEYNPHKQPIISPRPESDAAFLHGLLEGLSRIEQQGYARLNALGAAPLQRVLSAGGGAKNPQWQSMRQRLLGVPVTQAKHTEASFGAALLALHGVRPFESTNS